MHIDWPSAISQEILSEVRFEVAHGYFAQHCFFLPLPLPHMPVGIQDDTATGEKTKDPSLHKGNTGSQTLDYGLLPKGVDSYAEANELVAL